MKFTVLTLFPDLIRCICDESILGRAQKAGFISVEAVDIRAYSKDKHHRVDDTPYGGGKGMLIAAPPVYDCWHDVKGHLTGSVRTIYLSPQGRLLTQKKAAQLKAYDNLLLLCGHYEGIDARVLEEIVDEEISVGDYVLTGGELPACLLIDAVARLCPGVLADPSCYENESIASGLLEYPQYTRPVEFHGKRVPEVLLNGDHAQIERWRHQEALSLTRKKRPDLI